MYEFLLSSHCSQSSEIDDIQGVWVSMNSRPITNWKVQLLKIYFKDMNNEIVYHKINIWSIHLIKSGFSWVRCTLSAFCLPQFTNKINKMCFLWGIISQSLEGSISITRLVIIIIPLLVLLVVPPLVAAAHNSKYVLIMSSRGSSSADIQSTDWKYSMVFLTKCKFEYCCDNKKVLTPLCFHFQ